MNKKLLAAALGLLLVAGLVLYLASSSGDDTASSSRPSEGTNAQSQQAASDPSMESMDMPAQASTLPADVPQDGQRQAQSANNVTISNFAFGPKNITVKAGTTVTWTNNDTARHDVAMESGGEGPKSELLGKGESYSYTFQNPGTYNYICTPHPYMKASVTVTE